MQKKRKIKEKTKTKLLKHQTRNNKETIKQKPKPAKLEETQNQGNKIQNQRNQTEELNILIYSQP